MRCCSKFTSSWMHFQGLKFYWTLSKVGGGGLVKTHFLRWFMSTLQKPARWLWTPLIIRIAATLFELIIIYVILKLNMPNKLIYLGSGNQFSVCLTFWNTSVGQPCTSKVHQKHKLYCSGETPLIFEPTAFVVGQKLTA